MERPNAAIAVVTLLLCGAIGHTQAHLDPLSDPPPPSPRLALSEYGLSEADFDTSFDVGTRESNLLGRDYDYTAIVGNIRYAF